MTPKHNELVWAVEFRLDTSNWKTGFEKADVPWCAFYTSNQTFIDNLAEVGELPLSDGSTQRVVVEKYQTLMPDEQQPDENEEFALSLLGGLRAEYEANHHDRNLGFLTGNTNTIKKKVAARLAEWDFARLL